MSTVENRGTKVKPCPCLKEPCCWSPAFECCICCRPDDPTSRNCERCGIINWWEGGNDVKE